ncbi:MAG: UDP-glucose/GDP-mannose dehydrogenase family protein [Flavobacteriales bacterium]|jgi:UDPglucose 6-dehydrogenase|nr:UDP-glucose/GDP-mannose dehydrogenase family protein [Flavobacteriales bacterium]MBT3964189.1 UDP-glucose/GDP-mannose dehydrogenase family protein [Flavobacteriales bacterium]MBT4704838.1 UDP-glucose/GDP-mannose dehydrogenase family protein [Flavobacteriales bacterium]MBT4929613.1 UDP-glucose/GDP-mannose dehydrogenase family protein [Flavobacteriales bacterium]MBT5132945.1 UDP-glucose/GDP-mannose dehydrogenase family protein [Flavobacteriales bacterium]
MNIGVVGTGYVGLVTGTCLAEMGNHVVCVDIDEVKVKKMKNGEVPIYEPHLDNLFERNISQGRLSFSTNLQDAVDHASILFLALPTPPGADGSADLQYILKVAEDLGNILTEYTIVIDKSTVPVGTADKVRAAIEKNYAGEFDVVSNPEFLREGFAVDDFLKPDRVVIGTDSDRARSILDDLFKPFVRQGNPILFMDEKSAEMTKYAANSFLATKISFMNEIANLCEIIGADVDKVRIGIGSDTRIGNRFLFPGIGYGGSCFPKDVQAIVKTANDNDYSLKILESVIQVNEDQKTVLLPSILDYYEGDLSGKHFAMWGLAFKPDTDDIREAPALYIIEKLLERGATVTAYDPEAMGNVKKVVGDKISYAQNEYDALPDADALIICTEWSVFRTPEFSELDKKLKNKTIFDGRNLYSIESMEKRGYYYKSIGRRTVTA